MNMSGGGNMNSSSNKKEEEKELREKVRHYQKEAFQLANYYFVFQGVIFGAYYSLPSNSKCTYRWIPFGLSLVAGLLNLGAWINIAIRYKGTLDKLQGIGENEPQDFEAHPIPAAPAGASSADGGRDGGHVVPLSSSRNNDALLPGTSSSRAALLENNNAIASGRGGGFSGDPIVPSLPESNNHVVGGGGGGAGRNLPPQSEVRRLSLAEKRVLCTRVSFVIACMVMFGTFMGITLYGCWTIPCANKK